jgi:hypothetical protein
MRTYSFHGHAPDGATSATYNSWRAMIERCANRKHPQHVYYGARGIMVCERWRFFINFLADMGERPVGLTLDRFDNNGNYELRNCRWATPKEQANNRRKRAVESYARGSRAGSSRLTEIQVRIILKGGQSDAAFSRYFGVATETIRHIRLRKTWKHVQMDGPP